MSCYKYFQQLFGSCLKKQKSKEISPSRSFVNLQDDFSFCIEPTPFPECGANSGNVNECIHKQMGNDGEYSPMENYRRSPVTDFAPFGLEEGSLFKQISNNCENSKSSEFEPFEVEESPPKVIMNICENFKLVSFDSFGLEEEGPKKALNICGNSNQPGCEPFGLGEGRNPSECEPHGFKGKESPPKQILNFGLEGEGPKKVLNICGNSKLAGCEPFGLGEVRNPSGYDSRETFGLAGEGSPPKY